MCIIAPAGRSVPSVDDDRTGRDERFAPVLERGFRDLEVLLVFNGVSTC